MLLCQRETKIIASSKQNLDRKRGAIMTEFYIVLVFVVFCLTLVTIVTISKDNDVVANEAINRLFKFVEGLIKKLPYKS